ncbi:MAG: hypothetical protein EPO24_05635 [Bacteroidetes bacterium]|nr:MAG: hypothetical protein EPO24_05635 [Bacteroidota bacterium]
MTNHNFSNEDKISYPYIKPLIYGTLIVITLFLGSWIWIVNDSRLPTWVDRSNFGQMFGAINALFAGLAFAGVIVTIYLQSKELKLQRQELEDTRKEIKGQKEQLEIQNKTLLLQNFENKFFQLLSLHHQIVNSIDLPDGVTHGNPTFLKGRDCFKKMYNEYERRYQEYYLQHSKDYHSLEELINKSYLNFFNKYQLDIGHYFRNLYHIIKFIDKNPEISDKEFYTSLVRAQLSTYELALLFYNCLSELGNKKFKPLIVTYHLLKNLQTDVIIDYTMPTLFPKYSREEHISLYSESAFKQ